MEKTIQFEYKGLTIFVEKEGENTFFKYEDKSKVIHRLNLQAMRKFLDKPQSHATIDGEVIDIIEKSVKIKETLFNFEDLNMFINKYI